MALKVAVLLSGSGTTLQNLLDRAEAGELDVEFVCVIGSRADAYGLERARNHDIPAVPIVRKEFDSLDAFNAEIWETVRKYGAELVVLAGFMSLLEIPDDFANKVVNVHPALIPAFCGKGMYGHHVHEAVIEYGVKLSGATVHFANNEYDAGPIILQDTVPVLDDDTPDSLAERVQAKEREVYPEAIRLFAQGRLKVDGRRVRILEPN
jgi:formyltetrahydrofolate-dependent phosphoribosylglycinamide formyltransferase